MNKRVQASSKQARKQASKQASIQANKQGSKQANRQAYKQASKQANKQTNKQSSRKKQIDAGMQKKWCTLQTLMRCCAASKSKTRSEGPTLYEGPSEA